MSKDENLYINSYDELCTKVIHGYKLSFECSNLYLSKLLNPSSRILSLGCGTCHEVIELARSNPHWTFCAIDPSEEMLVESVKKIRHSGIQNRVDLICGYIETIEETKKFDAVTLFLVLARIIGNNNKLDFLVNINRRIKKNGYLVYLDLFNESNNHIQKLQEDVWVLHGLQNSVTKDFLMKAQTFGRNELHFNTKKTALNLFSKAGFEMQLLVAAACSYKTYLFKKTRDI